MLEKSAEFVWIAGATVKNDSLMILLSLKVGKNSPPTVVNAAFMLTRFSKSNFRPFLPLSVIIFR